jgi:ribosomal protein S18 acetylase RimI-like enzyme
MRATEFLKESILDELFQPGKDWQWSFTGSEEAVAVFHVGELPYMFHAYGTDGVWEVEFKRHGSKLDRSQKFGLTGTGNSAEVMSTIVDIMRAFLAKYKDKIEVLRFSAKEGSRQGLYAKMVKRLLPDWEMKQDGEEFILIAPKQMNEEARSARVNGLILKYAFNDRALIMKAFEPTTKNPLAYVKFVREDKELYPQDLWVNDEFRNKGIAKTMYDHLKNEGYVINRSHDQTKAGSGFWDKHRGEDAYVWEDNQ